MKKSMLILFASLLVLLSGCVRIEVDPQAFEREPMQEEPMVKPSTDMVPIVPEVVECQSCMERENKRCSEEVNTVVYRASCSETCGFPVSVRVPSNCKGSMQ